MTVLVRSLHAGAWWRQPSATLLLVLAASIVIYPFADHTRALRPLAQLIDVAVVLMVVRLIRSQVVTWRSGWVIGIPTVALQLWHLFLPVPTVELLMLIAQVVFHGYAAIALLVYVLHDEVITLDELFAAAGVYVLLGLLWASAYAVVLLLDPQAIVINAANNPDGVTGFGDLVYYSLTTLTSTGYGEITPVSPAARALAMLQQLIGVLFVALLISRLTNLYRAPRL
jgi:hypothetical protein